MPLLLRTWIYCEASCVPPTGKKGPTRRQTQRPQEAVGHLERWAKKDTMTARDILAELIRIRSDFRAYWDAENHFQDDPDSITPCGVFSQFTGFFRAQHLKMKKEEFEAVAALVSRCESDNFLTESAYTCFLENIAGDPPDETLAPYLSTAAVEFISHWRPEKKEPNQAPEPTAPSGRGSS